MIKILGNMQMLAGSTGWDLRTFLQNSFTTLTDWFGLAMMILGLIAIAISAYQIVTGLWGNSQKQVNYGKYAVLLFVGGALVVPSGFAFIQEIAKGGQQTIKDIGGQGLIMINTLKMLI